MTEMKQALEHLLDFSKPFDVGLFDKAAEAFFQGHSEVQALLVNFQNHPSAWTRVDAILEKSQSNHAKLLAVNILLETVKRKWKVLPDDQKKGIKNFTVGLIIKMSSDAAVLKAQSALITKLNSVLVQIVKHEWPHNWASFIPDLVNSSKSSQSLCANNMAILQLLSEEVFDFASGSMTHEKMQTMKQNLNKEFGLIFSLCDYILQNSTDVTLLSTTLKTLLRFLQWIPVVFIFETKLIETLALKFFPVSVFQNLTLQCLGEIGALKVDKSEYNGKFVALFQAVIAHVGKLLTDETDIVKVYASGDPKVQSFVRYLAIFLTGMLKSHLALLESSDQNTLRALSAALTLLLRISKVNDVVVFKICLEYWSALVVDLYNTNRTVTDVSSSSAGLVFGAMNQQQTHPRVKQYMEILAHLRRVMISKMAKPEEVLIVEDENGEIVRESYKDTDSIVLYKSMRECLIYLTHLDQQSTQVIMVEKLEKQVDGTEWSWYNLNTLCWAIGSISGALNETDEKNFLVRVIKTLLGLVEKKRGKDHKAVIAANIMYVVGQYPRFLKQHWKFLKTVVNKLFEFMHEKHPGVQDMSCDTFLKIAKKCRRKFVMVHQGESRPFIEEMLEGLPKIISDLEQGQIHTFFEAMGEIIQSESNPEKRQALVVKLMELPNQSWSTIIMQANRDPNTLWDVKTAKAASLVLKTNNRVASSLGPGYIVQLARIYKEMLLMYKMYSQFVSKKIASDGEGVTKTVVIRSMRTVKQQTLKLLQTFFQNCSEQDKESVLKQFVPELLDPVLNDYKSNVPDARDAEVLSLFAVIIDKFAGTMVQSVPVIFESVFQSTLAMITKNFEDFPDHRVQFFRLLQAINSNAFPALLRLSGPQFQLIMDAIIWAVKHLERTPAETGLKILFTLIENMEKTEVATNFYQQYFIPLTQDIFSVLTDTFHKPGFGDQAVILQRLFAVVDSGNITAPLWTSNKNLPAGATFPNNQTYVRQFVVHLLGKSFQNLTQTQVEGFVKGLFEKNTNLEAFKTHLRDFLVQLKEFNKDGADNSDLYSEERRRQMEEAKKKEADRISAVPGLQYQGPTQ